MGNDTPLIFEPLDSDEEDQPIIDYSQFIQNSDPEEEDLATQPIFLLGLDSQLPQMATSIDAVQPSRGSTALFSQPSQPSLPVSSNQASRQKRGRPKKSKSRAFTGKSKQSFKCKVNGVIYTVMIFYVEEGLLSSSLNDFTGFSKRHRHSGLYRHESQTNCRYSS